MSRTTSTKKGGGGRAVKESLYRLGWRVADNDPRFDDGNSVVGQFVHMEKLGQGKVTAYNHSSFGASSHTIEFMGSGKKNVKLRRKGNDEMPWLYHDPQWQPNMEQVRDVFDACDRGGRGLLSCADYAHFCQRTEQTDCDEDRWKRHTTVLGASADEGLSFEHFKKLYTHPGFGRHFGELDNDHDALVEIGASSKKRPSAAKADGSSAEDGAAAEDLGRANSLSAAYAAAEEKKRAVNIDATIHEETDKAAAEPEADEEGEGADAAMGDEEEDPGGLDVEIGVDIEEEPEADAMPAESGEDVRTCGPEPEPEPEPEPVPDTAAAQEKAAKQRRFIAQEMLSTEQTYVNALRTLVQVFRAPLKALLDSGKPILTPEQIDSIFNVIDTILAFHQDSMLPALRERLDDWAASSTIGDLFPQSTIAYLKIYTFYANNFVDAARTLRKCMDTVPAFKEFLGTCAPMCDMSLDSYLITPIQRIPRYVLLLKDMLKQTHDSHEDKSLLRTALEGMQQVGDHVNEKKREAEGRGRVMDIASQLRSSKMVRDELQIPADFVLVQPTRSLVLDGELEEMRHGGVLKKRLFFMFNDLLLKGVREKDGSISFRGMFAIDVDTVVRKGKAKVARRKAADRPPCLCIMGGSKEKGTQEKWVIILDTEKERDSWFDALDKCKHWKRDYVSNYSTRERKLE